MQLRTAKAKFLLSISFSCLFLMTLFSSSSYSMDKLTPSNKPIFIGMTTALSGPAAELGQEMKLGIDIYFAKVNANGGIAGRKLQLIALDDQYEPTQAAHNMHQLADNNQVLAVIGNVGTATATVTVPIANESKILLFGAYTGAGLLRKIPPDRYIINFRASYEEETAAMIQGLLSIGIKPDEIAFFTQNDSYGDSGYEGAMKALKAAGYTNPESLPIGRYTRNTMNVEEGLSEFIDLPKPPKAIVMVGTYAPNAKFIQLAKKEFPKTFFLNVSFVGSKGLAEHLGKNEENIIVTQVVPSLEADLPAVNDYRKDLATYSKGSTPEFGSLEGYLVAKLFSEGLQKAAVENKLTREGIIDTFESMHEIDIGIGVKVGFYKNDHQALDSINTIWPTILKDGKWVPLKWQELKKKGSPGDAE